MEHTGHHPEKAGDLEMRICVVFVTRDQEFGQFVGIEKERILPHSLSEKFSSSSVPAFTVFAFIVRDGEKPEDLTEFLNEYCYDHDGLVLIFESGLQEFVSPNRDAAFSWLFESYKARANPHNYLNANLSKAFRIYNTIIQRMNDAKFQQALLLPFCNFHAEEIVRLRDFFHESPMATDVVDKVELEIKNLRARQSPKKSSSYNDVYFIDDRSKYFQYGHERHARPETICPPHEYTCKIRSKFRFGVSYDTVRHFNVSEKDKNDNISGDFKNCHGGDVSWRGKRRHLNIFPNDHAVEDHPPRTT